MRTFLLFCGFTLAAITGFSQSYSVYFKTDKSTIETAAQHLLDSLLGAQVFKSSDSLNIRCHCDVRADSAYNYALSMRRAQSVQAYLQKSGVKSAMHLSAFGEVTPAYPNTETLRYKNRRCDIELKSPPKTKTEETNAVVDVKDWSEGFTMRLEGLEFVGNQAVPYWEGMPVLYTLLWDLTTYPDVEIALHGHVCCGDDMPLSIARAKAVYDFLVANNIDSNRLSYAGFSNSRPLVEEVDEITQKHNRRVEIVVAKEPNQVVAVAVKPLVFNVELRDIPWDGKTNVPTYEGSYNLDLLAKMMARSKGYRYTIAVYSAKSNQLNSRISYLTNYFLRRRVTANKLRLIKGDASRYQNVNMLTLEVIPVK